jgi:hypothetical protein
VITDAISAGVVTWNLMSDMMSPLWTDVTRPVTWFLAPCFKIDSCGERHSVERSRSERAGFFRAER